LSGDSYLGRHSFPETAAKRGGSSKAGAKKQGDKRTFTARQQAVDLSSLKGTVEMVTRRWRDEPASWHLA